MTTDNRFPLRLWLLFGWSLLTYFLFFELRELLMGTTLAEYVGGYTSAYAITLQVEVLFAFAAYAFSAYLLLYFFRRPLRGKPGAIIVLLLVGIMASILLRAFLEEFVLFHIFDKHNYNPDMSWKNYVLDNLYYSIVFTAVGIVFYFSELTRFAEKRRMETEALQRETELKFLRSQVNPHFLFNTLNNLYSLVSTNSDQALPALEKLSGMLRYSLYEKSTLVPLTQEIGYLEDLIHLEGLRVEDPAPPQITIGPFTHAWQLPPLLLVPFIENAFKHGEMRDKNQPLFISLTEADNTLHFRVENAVKENVESQDDIGGIGLANVRKRLKLVFPGRHRLVVTRKDGVFVVDLRVTASDAETGFSGDNLEVNQATLNIA